MKIKGSLLKFGIIERDGVKYSDPEKTILDFIYMFKYRGIPDEKITLFIGDYIKGLNKRKIKRYLKFYPKSVGRVVEDAGII